VIAARGFRLSVLSVVSVFLRRKASMKAGSTTFVVTALAVAGCTKAQSQGTVTLDTKLPVTFGQVSNVVELQGGRVAFVDTKSKLFLVADFKSGKVDTLGSRVDSLPRSAPAGQYCCG